MKIPYSLILGIVLGCVATFYYMAIQNSAFLAYDRGAVEAMKTACPALTDKFQAPAKPVGK